MRRSDLAERFDMSPQQASADISRYQDLAPENMIYDPASKAYLRTMQFRPLFVGEGADRYLLQLVAVASRWMDLSETWFSSPPPVEVVSLKRRATNPDHLLAVLDAIRDHAELSISYHSMTGTPETWRVVAPHAMAYSAGRWYVRAWSREHNDFRDYNLNRIRAARDLRSCTVDHGLDYEWAHKIDLVLVPNPGLPPERRRAVELEYEMTEGKLAIPVRLSLSFYLMSEHNLDVPPENLWPEKQQLLLVNRDDVEVTRRQVRALAKQALERAGPI
ncbi:MAG: hypothetical protein JWO83_151 [Caulobacteraceae bacterium]|nr:hypothetical protein [Caulobacteraceae bacterium]